MSASMWPIVRSLARTRCLLPLLPLAVAVIMRAGFSGRMDWQGSDHQSVLAVVVYSMVMPMLTIALASGWLRGEVGPWAWALARPIARGRWLATTLVVDIATLAMGLVLAYAVIGEMPRRWIGPWPDETTRELGYAALLVLVYCGAAFAGARGSNAIGATIYSAIAVASSVAVSSLWRAVASQWSSNDILADLVALQTILVLALAAIAIVVVSGRGLPARPRLSVAAKPLALAVLVAGVLGPIVTLAAFV
jgi:hypothetical protein